MYIVVIVEVSFHVQQHANRQWLYYLKQHDPGHEDIKVDEHILC